MIVAGLATSPIGVVQLIIQISRLSITANFPDEIKLFVNLLFFPVLIAMSVLTLPFFQAITAVIYYDIISRNGKKQNLVTDSPKSR